MMQPPEDDDKLVSFLRQNRPLPPLASLDLENRLMNAIVAEKQPQRQKSFLVWFIPSTIVAAIGIYWIGIDRTYQTANKIDNTEIEKAFLSDWQEVETSIDLPQYRDISGADWLLVAGEDENSPTTNRTLK